MKKLLWILALAVMAGVGVMLAALALWRDPEPEWTTPSSEAGEALEAGLEALTRVYYRDAVEHLERALELDPEFVAAKLFLARLMPGERRRWIEDLRAAVGRQDLTPRERFLVAYYLARFDRDEARAQRVLTEFQEHHPEDLFGLATLCSAHWEKQQWDAAEGCYERLRRLHPNWIEAQNRLGYIALARGRFAEAEERFQTYRYIAPDQANPYSSLAELLLLVGRYEEAAEALGETLRIKPDFCEAYRLQVHLGIHTGELDRAREAIRQAAEIPECDWLREGGYLCIWRAWVSYQEGKNESAWAALTDDCPQPHRHFEPIPYRIALITGHRDVAQYMEKALRAHLERIVALDQPVYEKHARAMMSHAEGVKHLVEGDLTAAADHFRQADERLDYWAPGLASFKLFNRMNLLRTLELSGRGDEADEVRRQIEAVNPRLVQEFEMPGFEALAP